MSAKTLSVSDLLSGSKQLNTVTEDKTIRSSNNFDQASVQSLEDLYFKHDGNLDKMYKILFTFVTHSLLNN
jgi:hypothetical protein